jgi:hypothetical protein
MRLLEFYGIDEALDEARSGHYTLEPEGNAMGRLLKWEIVPYDEGDDNSYEVVAHGSIDELIAALPPEILAMPDTEEGIRQAWDDAVQNGEAVYVEKNIVDITTKVGKGDRNRDDSDYDYDRDNGNKYF